MESLLRLIQKAKSKEPLKGSDLIELLQPFKDFYVYDPNCHYCGGNLRLTESPYETTKRQNDIINILTYSGKEHYDDTVDLVEFLEKLTKQESQENG